MPLSRDQASHFSQIVVKRYGPGSTIRTRNFPFAQWAETFGGHTPRLPRCSTASCTTPILSKSTGTATD
ncbi:ATP-binding protein [Burkholderia sp. Ac-20384]|uniref:ATP-binding protein n=1 Tax=Burkholderia sp. Ac-20384 TaxID=2703902 RepID=UPI0032173D93